jgi:hypothetical protein
MHSITANEYDRKLHYTATLHEEGLLPERCPAPNNPLACNECPSIEQETDFPKKAKKVAMTTIDSDGL